VVVGEEPFAVTCGQIRPVQTLMAADNVEAALLRLPSLPGLR
jgi:hypothetical protein